MVAVQYFYPKRALKCALWLLVFCWWDALSRRRHSDPRNAALLVKTDAIGDFVLCAAMLRRLADIQRARGLACVLVCNRMHAELARSLFPDCRIVLVDIKRFVSSLLYRRRILADLPPRVSVAINLAVSHDLILADALIRASNATRRECVRGAQDRNGRLNQRLSLSFYTHIDAAKNAPVFEAEHLRAGLIRMGYDMKGLFNPLPALADAHPCPLPVSPYFVILPGAQKSFRQWPAEKFAELGRRLIRETGWRCVVCGTPGEGRVGAKIARDMNGNVLDLTGETTLLDCLALIRHSALVLANDSAAAHMAAACRVPCAAARGGGYDTPRFLPYPETYDLAVSPVVATHPMPCSGCEWHCRHLFGMMGVVPCIGRIPVEGMTAAALRAISGQKKTRPVRAEPPHDAVAGWLRGASEAHSARYGLTPG